MSLSNKKFRNNKTGEIVKVIDSFEDIAILENKQKVNVSNLMNTSLYTEEIDPNIFFNSQGSYNILAEKIKSINTSNMRDDDDNIPVTNSPTDAKFIPANYDSAITYSSEEEERAELARKYGISQNNNSELQRQNEAFAKLLEDETLSDVETSATVETILPEKNITPMKSQQVNEDPILTMFKNVKRNKEFSITLEINNKIPRPDFIELMEDSYNVSIIDFLAEEFTQSLLQNPYVIKDSIVNKIKEMVYGKSESTVNPQITDSVTIVNESEEKVEKPKLTRKPKPNTTQGEKPGYKSPRKKETGK